MGFATISNEDDRIRFNIFSRSAVSEEIYNIRYNYYFTIKFNKNKKILYYILLYNTEYLFLNTFLNYQYR